MRKIFIVTLLCGLACWSIVTAQPVRQYLYEDWEFRQARGVNWYPAKIPGTVHTDLMNNRLIEDPFFRLNERGVQWVDKEDWIYRTSFDLTPEVWGKSNIVLRFNGLDTYADVTLNGKKLFSADNMFREWQADVKSLLKEKGNELQIYFHSPIKIAMPQWEKLPFQYRSSNDQSENGGLIILAGIWDRGWSLPESGDLFSWKLGMTCALTTYFINSFLSVLKKHLCKFLLKFCLTKKNSLMYLSEIEPMTGLKRNRQSGCKKV